MNARLVLTLAPGFSLALLAAGCGGGAGDGLPRQPVAGTVTIDGQPIASGLITFRPKNGPEPVATAVIEDGEFSLARHEGPVPGPHAVSVWAREATGRKVPDPYDPENLVDEVKDIVPPRYNLSTELSAEIAEGKNSLEFPLQGAGG
jgi:hypothetical protein